MNLSASAMLVNKSIRPVKVEYDPETFKNNNPNKLFKTLDPTIKKDDLVIVPTATRHGFTVVKVTDVDFPIDFNGTDQWGWIGGKFDKASYDEVLKTEGQIVARIGKVQEDKMRQELKDAAGLGEVDFTDLDLMQPRLASPHGVKEDPLTKTPPAAPPYNPPVEF